MPWSAPAGDDEHDRAAAWFASRVPVTDADRASIPADARSRAFWIAGVAQLDVVQQVHAAIVVAQRDGTALEEFKKQVSEALTKAWGKEDPARIGLIFRNACQTSYNAARWEQMREPTVMRMRPYWLYDAIKDGRTSAICLLCGGTILPADDAWWDSHWPPLHHHCRSSVRNLRRSEAEKRGITAIAPFDQPDTGFGLSPRRAREWQPDAGSRDAGLMAELQRKKRDLDRRPAPPPLPKTFDHSQEPVRKKQTPKETLPAGGKPVKLTKEQQKAEMTAATMRGDFRARQNASLADRRTWMLWERVRGNSRRTSVLVEHAAIRQFGLTGVPWAKGAEHTFQEADVVRAERDLRAIYDQTQAWFKRRGVRAITLYRGVHGGGDDIRRSVESWTSDKATAQRFADRGTDGYVLRVTVPVTQVLVHHQVSEWVDGPFGGASEFLVMW